MNTSLVMMVGYMEQTNNMSFFKNPIAEIESFLNPSNEQKALNALNVVLTQVQVVAGLVSLVPQLSAVSGALVGVVTIIKTAITDLEAVMAAK